VDSGTQAATCFYDEISPNVTATGGIFVGAT